MRTHFNTYQQKYSDGGVLHISIWKDESGYLSTTYMLPGEESCEAKPGYEGDVSFKLNNGRERPLFDVWREVKWMLKPTD
ncbi:MAG TPA: hypothetical protein VK658_14730 [Chryseolinea sp.]|nr:hypothetical protein [Chryseolinea sp.]